MQLFYKNYLKRLFDIFLSLVLLIAFLPFVCLVIVIIKLDSSGPILFTQKRLGMNATVFDIYKFRTMYHKNRTSKSEIFLNNPEITKFGKILRRFKLDEIPQLINVLIGDMSIVGPRPGLTDQLSTLTDFGRKRLDVRPGLTGLSQISGNIFLSWEKRWEYDDFYINNIGFWYDLKIIIKTLSIVMFGEENYIKDNN